MLGKLRSDFNAIMERDPAAQGVFAAIFLYPSFHVLLFHRIAHPLWGWNFKFIARALMLFARWLTGIEIHPCLLYTSPSPRDVEEAPMPSSA